ncbi:Uncharacterized protein QTN25_001306 [Entamoeba marina]
MSKVNQQQGIINKAVDAFEKHIKAWAALAGLINQALSKFIEQNDVVDVQHQIELLSEYSERLYFLFETMTDLYTKTLQSILKLEIGTDSSVAPHYHHQCEMLEQILNIIRFELVSRQALLTEISHFTPTSIVQEKQSELVNSSRMNEVESLFDTLKTPRSFSGLVNKNLR